MFISEPGDKSNIPGFSKSIHETFKCVSFPSPPTILFGGVCCQWVLLKFVVIYQAAFGLYIYQSFILCLEMRYGKVRSLCCGRVRNPSPPQTSVP